MKTVFTQLSRKFGSFGTYVAPAYHHDRCERSVPMRLYAMHKRDFVIMFSAFFASFGLCFVFGITGPTLTTTTAVNSASLYPRPKGSITSTVPFNLKSPVLSLYCQQLWVGARILLEHGDDEKFKKLFHMSISVYGISSNNKLTEIMHDAENRTRELDCFGIVCNAFTLLHIGSLNFPQYLTRVQFHGLERIEENYKIKDLTFYFKKYSPAFTRNEIWLRVVCLTLTFGVMCWFHYSLRPFSIFDWSIEQKWVSVLLPLCVLFNDPVYPLCFLINSWLPQLADALFQCTYVCSLLIFWLWMYHGIRQVERTCTQFYAPKLILVGLLWTIALTALLWEKYNEDMDPTLNYNTDNTNFMGFKGAFFVAGFMYISYLLYLIVRAFTELHSMPFFAIRLKFCTALLVIVLAITVAITTCRVGIFKLEDNFTEEFNDTHIQSIAFTSQFCLMNLYTAIMAFAYAPPKTAYFEVRVKDNPTLSMINDSDDDVIYGSEAESHPLTNRTKGQQKEESD